MKDFITLAKERYSVRKFKDAVIEREKLSLILEAAKVAPTACNYQAVKIYVLESNEALERINSLSRCIFGAKTVLLVCYDTSKEWKSPFESDVHSGVEDASIVATHMMLEAYDLGIGSCWVNLFNTEKVKEAFELPENMKPVLLMPLGYVSEDAHPAHLHNEYPNWENMVEYK